MGASFKTAGGRTTSLGGFPRILILGEFPPPSGGMAEQAEILKTCLQKEGIIVRTCRTNIVWRGLLSFLEKVRVIRTLLKLPVIYGHFLLNLIRSDVLHIFSNSFLSFYLFSVFPLLLSRISGKRTILNYHGGAAAVFFQGRMAWLRPVFGFADAIVVPSHYLEKTFESYGLCTEVVPNMANLERFAFRKRERFRPKFIVTRHLEPEYGIDIILRAFQKIVVVFPDAQLTVVGSGTQTDSLKALVKELGIEEKVFFVGRVKNSALPDLYSNMDMMLNASRIDNVPMSIIEAFASGLPVVSTRAGGIPYVVEHGVDGILVDIDDAESLAEGARTILGDAQYGKTLVANAREKVDSWSWPRVRPKILGLYGVTV